jgi:hypothetical protein
MDAPRAVFPVPGAHQRLATNKPEPLFKRKHGEVPAFAVRLQEANVMECSNDDDATGQTGRQAAPAQPESGAADPQERATAGADARSAG